MYLGASSLLSEKTSLPLLLREAGPPLLSLALEPTPPVLFRASCRPPPPKRRWFRSNVCVRVAVRRIKGSTSCVRCSMFSFIIEVVGGGDGVVDDVGDNIVGCC